MNRRTCPSHSAAVRSHRDGFAMWLALSALAVCSVLAISLARAQTVTVLSQRNTTDRVSLTAAVRTGQSLAAGAMTQDTWGGVGTSATIELPPPAADRTLSVTYEFLPDDATPPHPLRVLVRSTATATLATGPLTESSDQLYELNIRLDPDDNGVDDVRPLPDGYAAKLDQTVAAFNSVSMSPNVSVEGHAGCLSPATFLAGLNAPYSSTVALRIGLRDEVNGSGDPVNPHPLQGHVASVIPVYGSQGAEYSQLGIVRQSQSFASPPDYDWSATETYQLYEGGPTYSAVDVSGTLSNVTLGPTATNPLGVFFSGGTVIVSDDVTLVGTLIAETVRITGDDVALAATAAADWHELDPARWPRQPVVVAESLRIERSARGSIDGNILAASAHRFAAADQPSSVPINISSIATVEAEPAPVSKLRFPNAIDLSAVVSSDHDVWVDANGRGSRHRIVAVDAAERTLDVVGEWPEGTSLVVDLRSRSAASVWIRGQVFCESFGSSMAPVWDLTTTEWDTLYSDWTTENNARAGFGLPPISYPRFLADPANHATATNLTRLTHGLRSDPTLHIRPAEGIRTAWQTPLFRVPQSTATKPGGYKWTRVR